MELYPLLSQSVENGILYAHLVMGYIVELYLLQSHRIDNGIIHPFNQGQDYGTILHEVTE